MRNKIVHSFKADTLIKRGKEVLDDGLKQLHIDGTLPNDFEERIEKAWGRANTPLHYSELKTRMNSLADHPLYGYVAVRYMENDFQCIPVEFQNTLRIMYGVQAFNNSTIMEDRKKFWATFSDSSDSSGRDH